ncbi:DivIVA domain-containing protein [Streptococcus hillyeri]|uniref:Cell cycle protein GpsB n=1 Tax=Streptococcus hillyeri TaxID=2282420 RepID=A0A3L9DUU6_9STRE|nr:DivIVA domain-containing protein [Streptococcus hillyeri]RLY02952.1 DivIVA domain-containing protein [Streptococcus hillyeri]
MAKIMLSPKDIFEREFKIVLRGYDKDEIDEFLDEIIKDYETYEAQLQALRQENEQLREQFKNQMAETTPLAPETQVFTTPLESERVQPELSPYTSAHNQLNDLTRLSASVTNFDILKRISRLEKEVFGKQIVE